MISVAAGVESSSAVVCSTCGCGASSSASCASSMHTACSVAAPRFLILCVGAANVDAAFGVISVAFARFFDGSANSMRCFTTMASEANARSLVARSSADVTSC